MDERTEFLIMDTQVILNITTISISTILSVGSIILSIWFYRESNKQNKETSLLQTEIRNAIEKLEQLYNTYTDTFGALKTQLDAMQKHIFTSSVGDTATREPNNLRFSVLGCITERKKLTLKELCTQVTGFKETEIQNIVYCFHQEGLISFDGNIITYTKTINQNIEGAGVKSLQYNIFRDDWGGHKNINIGKVINGLFLFSFIVLACPYILQSFGR